MDRYIRRTPLYRDHVRRGARFTETGNAAVVQSYAADPNEGARAARLGLADLTAYPRVGLRGPGAAAWLASIGMRLPSGPNSSVQQNDGSVVLCLAPQEYLLLSAIPPAADWHDNVLRSHAQEREVGIFTLPRGDSHGWLAMTGELSPEVLAKVCAVDFRPHKFASGRVAQTSLARVDGIVARNDLGVAPCFFVLSDVCSLEYLWCCFLDAMEEFGGAPVGVQALVWLSRDSERRA